MVFGRVARACARYVLSNSTKASYSYTATKGTCKDSSSTTDSVQGSVTGYKDVSKVDGRAPMSAVARQHVSAAIKADQSSFQPYRSECEQTVKLVRRTQTPKRRSCPRGSVGTMHP